MPRAELLQYNIDYDRHETDTSFIMTQLETHLKERFNVLVSTVEYEIVDGHLVRPGKTEPFIESIKRGRDLLRRLSTTDEDFEREDAEVTGFSETIDPVMSDPNTPENVIVLNISLPSGKYKHRYHDMATFKKRNGKRHIEYSRYSSGLTAQDYAEILPGMDPENPPSPEEFLATPIVLKDINLTSEQVHRLLHKHHEYMTTEDFSEIWRQVKGSVFVRNYLLNRDPDSFNGMLNFTDDVWENIKRRKNGQVYRDYVDYPLSYSEQRSVEIREVRQVPTACPGKSGADSPWSVSEFDFEPDLHGSRTFNCPACGYKNVRPHNELISVCQNKFCSDPSAVSCGDKKASLPLAA